MGLLFILDGTDMEPINEFLNIIQTVAEHEDQDGKIFRIIQSKETKSLTCPPTTSLPIELTENDFAGMSMDEIEAWMLFRVKEFNDIATWEEKKERWVDKHFFAMDTKDVRDRTCTAFQIMDGETGRLERTVVKVRIPWKSVWPIAASLEIDNTLLEECTKESIHSPLTERAIPLDGWCTFPEGEEY